VGEKGSLRGFEDMAEEYYGIPGRFDGKYFLSNLNYPELEVIHGDY